MKIGRRLFMGFAIIILINVAAGAMIINNVGSVQHYYNNKKTMDSLISHIDDCRLAESRFRSSYDTNLVIGFQSDYLNVSRDLSNMGAFKTRRAKIRISPPSSHPSMITVITC